MYCNKIESFNAANYMEVISFITMASLVDVLYAQSPSSEVHHIIFWLLYL